MKGTSMYRRNGNGGRAFDAASGGGLAFLNAELSIPHTKLVEPLEEHTYKRDIVMKFGGGFPEYITAWASSYATSGGNEYGLAGTQNSDIPLMQADIQQGNWVTWNWYNAMFIAWADLQKLETAKRNQVAPPFSLDDLLRKGVRIAWNKALDKVVYLGWLGQPGLVNSSDVTSALAAAVGTGSSTTWASKTGIQIFNDVQAALYAAVANSGFATMAGCPDSLLVPFTQHALLSQPMGVVGGVYISMSIQEYIEKYCLCAAIGKKFTINPLPNPWISTQGASNSARAVYYRNNEDDVLIHVPQEIIPAMTIPSTRRGPGYESVYAGNIGQVMWLRPQTAFYQDGI
jgi:hypothetical protein